MRHYSAACAPLYIYLKCNNTYCPQSVVHKRHRDSPMGIGVKMFGRKNPSFVCTNTPMQNPTMSLLFWTEKGNVQPKHANKCWHVPAPVLAYDNKLLAYLPPRWPKPPHLTQLLAYVGMLLAHSNSCWHVVWYANNLPCSSSFWKNKTVHAAIENVTLRENMMES